MLPVKEPRDELRVEAAKQRTHTDKYVTVIETGTNETEVDFNAQSLLSMSADHFKVGVDELVVCLSRLSIVEVDNAIMFEIMPVLEGLTPHDGNTEVHMGLFTGIERERFQFRCNRIYRNSLDVNERLNEIGKSVRQYMIDVGCQNQGGPATVLRWCRPVTPLEIGNNDLVDTFQRDIQFTLSGNGQLIISAPAIFWANFYIHIPDPRYRSIIVNSSSRDVISLHPFDGSEVRTRQSEFYVIQGPDFDNNEHDNVLTNNLIGPAVNQIPDDIMKYTSSSSFLTNLNRVVSIELSSSLPIKHSPLIDHQSLSYTISAAEGLSRGEVPDYALGRFLVNFQPKISYSGSDGYILETSIGPVKLASTDQRICYQHLRPQERITQMRMKLWCRVRKYSVAADKWFMKTILCPVGPMDYWCAKLHFSTKKDHHY